MNVVLHAAKNVVTANVSKTGKGQFKPPESVRWRQRSQNPKTRRPCLVCGQVASTHFTLNVKANPSRMMELDRLFGVGGNPVKQIEP